MKTSKSISDKWLIFAIIALGIHFIVRLIDESQIMWNFPLDTTNDISSYMAMLHFLYQYGYHAFVPNWYNGFTSFDIYPPGWMFFVYPLYLLTKNVMVTSYASLIIEYVIGGFIFYHLGRILKISRIKTIAFYVLFFCNPIMIGNYIRLGRVQELFTWLIFIGLTAIMLYYKDRKLDKRFIWFIPLYALLIITHQAETILFSFVFIGLFISRKYFHEHVMLALCWLGGILLSSFWLVRFLLSVGNTSVDDVVFSKWLFDFSGGFLLTNIANIVIPIALLVCFYLYWRSKDYSRKELLFFSPILALNALFFFKIVAFIPLLKHVYPDPYEQFFIFFILYFFMATDFSKISGWIKKIVKVSLIIIPIAFIAISLLHTPWFKVPGELENDVLSLLPSIEGRFGMIGIWPSSSYPYAYYSYAAIYYNLNSVGGWANIHASPEYIKKFYSLNTHLSNRDCSRLQKTLNELNTTELILHDDDCDFVEQCGGFSRKIKKGRVCLFKVENEM